MAAAPGGEPGAPAPMAQAGSDVEMAGGQPLGAAGSARSVYASLGLATWAIALVAPWGNPADLVPREQEVAQPVVSGSGGIETPNRSAGIGPDNLPAPRGADLITDIAAFRQAPIEESLHRLFDRFRGADQPSERQAQSYPYLLPVALAVVAIEAARRWRRRSTREPSQSRRARNFVMNSLR
jgi:hypothetical protein